MPAPADTGPYGEPEVESGAALEVLRVTLRLGLTSFGGPIAHLGYQRAAFVERQGWLDDHAFAQLVALCQTLPGPASSQLTIAVGRLRAGWSGALAAWIGFTLPSALFMAAVGIGVAAGDLPTTGPAAGAVAGLKVAAVAVVAHAVLAMGRRLTPDAPRLALAAVAAVISLAAPSPFTQVALIAGAALLAQVAWRGRRAGAAGPGRPSGSMGGRRTAIGLGAAFLGILVVSQIIALATREPGAGFLAALIRSGALVFGGGHVVLPLLDAGVVAPGWVGEGSFVAGYGLAQAVPGPLFTFGTYLGAVSSAGPGGIAGAFLATIAIFLPGALLVLAALPMLGGSLDRPRVQWSLAAVNAAVVGILLAALITPVGTAGITSPLAAVVAAAGATLLVTGRVPPLFVVAGSALIMALAAA
jgi:chromate transporter